MFTLIRWTFLGVLWIALFSVAWPLAVALIILRFLFK